MGDLNNTLLELHSISKFFPGVKALDQVELEIKVGEIHAVCGENGAGKSTLMRILGGIYAPDQGEIFFKGQPVQLTSYREALDMGIAIVHQEKSLCLNLSIAENIFMSPPGTKFGLIDHRRRYEETQKILTKVGLGHLSHSAKVEALSVGEQQMVELAKALSQRPRLLILDEPTASVTEKEVAILFNLVRQLKGEGTSVIYISHRMAEVFSISEKVTVLKDGRYMGTLVTRETTVDAVIRLMVGRDMVHAEYSPPAPTDVMLETSGLSGQGFGNVDIYVRQGEIVGLAGLVGAGRSEVARTLIGGLPIQAGETRLAGQRISPNHPRQAYQMGIGYLPEDRKNEGLFLDMTVEENILSGYIQQVRGLQGHNRKENRALVEEYIKLMKITPPDPRQKAMHLSGGNQQKVLLARCLLSSPRLLIIDEPTHGVDVGAKSEIYGILRDLAARGVAILFVSSELPEVITLGDRVYVMHQGRVTAELLKAKEELTEENIMHYASGTKDMFQHMAIR